MELYLGDCLEIMKDIETNSIDLLFCDLPYGQTSCKWDCLIDLDLFWKQVNRICKDKTPMFFTCSTKFGVSLINSNPKNFRYDLVWVKSAPCGFLNAKKMPMKKHEMVYVFYKKLPLYDLSSHTHKFLKETENKRNGKNGVDNKGMIKNRSKTEIQNKYDPPLPTSVVRESTTNEVYESPKLTYNHKKRDEPLYDPPLPTSVIKTDLYSSKDKDTKRELYRNESGLYDPPLPTSVIKEKSKEHVYKSEERVDNGKGWTYPSEYNSRKNGEPAYEPPLPTSILEVKSQKGKHATQKPTALMEWILKYYSKEGDVVLDPTMGSGSTGIACKNMNRNFIGIELDEEIYKVAQERIFL
tara:strand:+ start:68 stop:1129 length:1062 start_codon:yes stop_codon:yes gene_type:complete